MRYFITSVNHRLWPPQVLVDIGPQARGRPAEAVLFGRPHGNELTTTTGRHAAASTATTAC
jgi:hypothetical protein